MINTVCNCHINVKGLCNKKIALGKCAFFVVNSLHKKLHLSSVGFSLHYVSQLLAKQTTLVRCSFYTNFCKTCTWCGFFVVILAHSRLLVKIECTRCVYLEATLGKCSFLEAEVGKGGFLFPPSSPRPVCHVCVMLMYER